MHRIYKLIIDICNIHYQSGDKRKYTEYIKGLYLLGSLEAGKGV